MFKKLLPFVLLLPLAGCGPIVSGSGNSMTEERPLGNITEIKLSDIGDLTVTFGSTNSIEISGDDNIVPLVNTSESGGKLTISVKGNISTKTPLKYKVQLQKLESISLSGSGNATVQNWVAKEVQFDISGAGNLTIPDCDIHKMKGKLSGAGTITVSGTSDEVSFKISGAGNVKAESLQTDIVAVEISGAGSAKVWADKELNAKVSGAGTVHYKGNPNVKSNISGAGSVKALK